MEVKSYKKKQNNMYEVTFSNGEKYNLYDDVILKYELLINKSISPSTLKKIINDNNKKDVYYKALKYISIRMRSKKEMRDYLKKNEYSPSEISFALESLQKDGYLDDKVYAKAYVNDQINLGSHGPRRIFYDLKKLGIDEKYINDALNKVKEKTWRERIEKIIEKRKKTNKDSLYIFKTKLRVFLIKEGYNDNIFNEMIDNLDFNTDDIFKKEAEKEWNKLSRKYSDVELKLKFKNKMYQKGFSVDQINSYVNED